jgi:hypothetical protein
MLLNEKCPSLYVGGEFGVLATELAKDFMAHLLAWVRVFLQLRFFSG